MAAVELLVAFVEATVVEVDNDDEDDDDDVLDPTAPIDTTDDDVITVDVPIELGLLLLMLLLVAFDCVSTDVSWEVLFPDSCIYR